MVVLDTNTVVHYFRGEGNVAERLLACRPDEVALPAVVVCELETGSRKAPRANRRRAQLQRLLDVVAVLPFDRAAAIEAAAIRAELEAIGTPIGPMDTLIAATARAVGGVLVTRNVREFGRVPGLRVESWYAE